MSVEEALPPALILSRRHGQVQLRGKIQRGSFASVFAGQNANGESVAVKVVDTRLVAPEFQRFISSEMRIVQQLRHENIIEVFDVVELDAHRISIIMRLARHGDLLDYVNTRQRLSEDEARNIFRQVVSAVLYAHMKGVAHRDLKLDNILLDLSPQGELKAFVADWGFATAFSPSERALNESIGSLPYASPELVLGKTYFGPEIDVWALGVILYTMVAGKLPFGADAQASTRENIIACRYEMPSACSRPLRDLLRHMLHPDPDTRASLHEVENSAWMTVAPRDDSVMGKLVRRMKNAMQTQPPAAPPAQSASKLVPQSAS